MPPSSQEPKGDNSKSTESQRRDANSHLSSGAQKNGQGSQGQAEARVSLDPTLRSLHLQGRGSQWLLLNWIILFGAGKDMSEYQNEGVRRNNGYLVCQGNFYSATRGQTVMVFSAVVGQSSVIKLYQLAFSNYSFHPSNPSFLRNIEPWIAWPKHNQTPFTC